MVTLNRQPLRRLIVILSALAVSSIASGCASQRGAAPPGLAGEEQQVFQRQKAWVDAALRRDADAFASFMDDSFKGVGRAGRVRTKQEWVASIRSGQATYDRVEYRNVTVRLYGDVAVISGEYLQSAASAGRDNSGTGVFVGTWVRRDGDWKIVASIYPGTTQTPR